MLGHLPLMHFFVQYLTFDLAPTESQDFARQRLQVVQCVAESGGRKAIISAHLRTTGWTIRGNVRAQLRVVVKRILRKHGYPPDK